MARDIRAGGAFVEMYLKDGKLTRGLKGASRQLKAFGASITKIGGLVTGLAGSIAGPLAAAVGIFAKAGDQLDKVSRRTGFAVEALSTLGFAAEQSGSSMETLQRAAKGQANAIQELGRNSATYVDTFDALGLTFDQLSKLSPEDQFKLIADRLAGVENFGERAALSMDIFGRSGQELLPLLEEGARGIEALQARGRELGLEVSTEDAKQAAELTDRINELKRVALNTAFNIGAALGGSVSDIVKKFAEAGAKVTSFVKKNRSLILTVAKVTAVVLAVGVGITALGIAIIGVGAVIGGLATVIATIGTVIGAILSPVGLVIAGIVALGAALAAGAVAFVRYTEAGREAFARLTRVFNGVFDTVKRVFGGVRDALAAGDLKLAVKILWLGIKLEFTKGVNFVREKWINFKFGFLKASSEAFIGAKAVLANALAAMKGLFNDFQASTRSFWSDLKADVKSVGNLIVVSAKKAANEARGLLDDSFDVGAANNLAEDAFAARQSEIEAADKLAQETIDSERAAREKEIQDELNDRLAGLAQDLADAQKERDDAFNEQIGELEAAITDSEKELAASIRRAAEANDAQAEAVERATRVGENTFTPSGPGIPGTSGIARGLFNTAAIRSLMGAGPESPQVREQKKTNRVLGRMLRELIQQDAAKWAR